MRIIASGYNSSFYDSDPGEPVEVRVFEGPEEVIDAEITAFGVRFKWVNIEKEEDE